MIYTGNISESDTEVKNKQTLYQYLELNIVHQGTI